MWMLRNFRFLSVLHHRMFSKTKAMFLVISSVPDVTHKMIEVVWIPLCNDSQVEYGP